MSWLVAHASSGHLMGSRQFDVRLMLAHSVYSLTIASSSPTPVGAGVAVCCRLRVSGFCESDERNERPRWERISWSSVIAWSGFISIN